MQIKTNFTTRVELSSLRSNKLQVSMEFITMSYSNKSKKIYYAVKTDFSLEQYHCYF